MLPKPDGCTACVLYTKGRNACILWPGATIISHGHHYGVYRIPGKRAQNKRGLVHRRAYEQMNGPIPAGLVIDHLCRNTLCINPTHLEAVTNKENILRGYSEPAQNKRKTHCKWGHSLTPDNLINKTRGGRICKICNRRYLQDFYARKARNL